MENDFWYAVRQRAHALWLQEGCPEGRSEQHWQQAQRDVLESVHVVPVISIDPLDEATSPEEALVCPADAVEAPPITEGKAGPMVSPIEMATTLVQGPRKGTSFFKVSPRQCRFIVSESSSPTFFCGAPTAGGSWCQEHRARVFVRAANPSLKTSLKRITG